MQLSTMELLIVSVGLSIDVYGSRIFKDQMEESGPLKRSVWRYSAWGTGTWKPDHIAAVTVYYQDEDSG